MTESPADSLGRATTCLGQLQQLPLGGIIALPKAKVLMLSAHSDDVYVSNATESGAVGFLFKQTSAHDVCRAIRKVHQDKTLFSPAISERLHPQLRDRAGALKKKVAQLTSHDLQVLQLIAEGKANKQTAAELGIGIKTVEKHREYLMEKPEIHDTAGLKCYAISAGIAESSVQLTDCLTARCNSLLCADVA